MIASCNLVKRKFRLRLNHRSVGNNLVVQAPGLHLQQLRQPAPA